MTLIGGRYIIIARAMDGSSYIVERELADTNWQTTVDDLASGQVDHPLQVIEFDTGRDVTDKAQAACRDRGDLCGAGLRSFAFEFC